MTESHVADKHPRRRMLAASTVSNLILDAAAENRPFSLVRLGDGEGALLLHGVVQTTAEDQAYFETHFGVGFPTQALNVFSCLLRESMSTADIIGMRDDIWNSESPVTPIDPDDNDFELKFRSLLKLRPVEKDINGHALRRFYGLYHWMKHEMPHDAEVCSAWISFDLGLQRFWERLLKRRRHISMINCSADLPIRMAYDFGLEVEHIRVPDRDSDRARWSDDNPTERIYPDSYERVMKALDMPQGGKLFLIGAGIPGKAYAHVIKQRGGIALDVGGLMDAWDGRSTRPAVFATKLSNNIEDGHLTFMLRPPLHRRLLARFRR